jgi:hypothetical protein
MRNHAWGRGNLQADNIAQPTGHTQQSEFLFLFFRIWESYDDKPTCRQLCTIANVKRLEYSLGGGDNQCTKQPTDTSKDKEPILVVDEGGHQTQSPQTDQT